MMLLLGDGIAGFMNPGPETQGEENHLSPSLSPAPSGGEGEDSCHNAVQGCHFCTEFGEFAPTVTPRSAAVLRIALLACSVFEREIALYTHGATHLAEIRFFEMGLHDRPDRLRATLQENLEEVSKRSDIEAVVLAYGLCGRGTAGLHPLRHRLVIPRAHDCITMFLGSKEAYAEHQRHCPTCYYYTPGWNRGRRVPGPDRLATMRTALAEKYDPDDVDYLVETEQQQWSMNDTAAFLELGTEDAQVEADYARRCAKWLGWKFEHHRGNPALLQDLLWGRWDQERFQIIEPGMKLGQAPDHTVLRAEPV